MKKAEPDIEKVENTESEPLVPVEPATMTREQLEELKARALKADEIW